MGKKIVLALRSLAYRFFWNVEPVKIYVGNR